MRAILFDSLADMKNIWTIAKREYHSYFSNPAAYIILFSVLLILGVYFYSFDLHTAFIQRFVPPMGRVLGLCATLLVLAAPALTARLLTEEHRLGTLELLLTAPIRDIELVIGKWLGASFFLLTIVAITIFYPVILNQFVDPGIDWGPVMTGYLALISLCLTLAAVGVAISALFKSQIAAFITTMFFFILFWWILGPITQVVGYGTNTYSILSFLDWGAHVFNNLLRGILDIGDFVFFISVTILALSLATITVGRRNWG
jgi:ABC-2 type transport system permease protein